MKKMSGVQLSTPLVVHVKTLGLGENGIGNYSFLRGTAVASLWRSIRV